MSIDTSSPLIKWCRGRPWWTIARYAMVVHGLVRTIRDPDIPSEYLGDGIRHKGEYWAVLSTQDQDGTIINPGNLWIAKGKSKSWVFTIRGNHQTTK